MKYLIILLCISQIVLASSKAERGVHSLEITSLSKEEVNFIVPGLMCESCANKVTNAFKTREEVKKVTVDLKAKKVLVNFVKGKYLTKTEIAETVKMAGFELN